MTVKEGAKVVVESSLGVKKGEAVLIITDTIKEGIAKEVFDAVLDAEGEAIMVRIAPRKMDGEDLPEAVASMMLDVDVIIGITDKSFTHTQARRRANRAGVRIATMPGISEGMMSDGAMLADFREIERTMRRVYRKIRGSKEAHISSELGSDLHLDLRGRHWITEDTGICRKKGQLTNLPAGEIFIAPLEGTAEGKLVVDGSFYEPLEEPATIWIKKGYATRIVGAKNAVKEMNKGGREGRSVAELGIGLNPQARIIGNVLEDGKVLGAAHVSFGDNSTFGGKVRCGVHVDAIMKKPRVEIDGKVVIENGELKI